MSWIFAPEDCYRTDVVLGVTTVRFALLVPISRLPAFVAAVRWSFGTAVNLECDDWIFVVGASKSPVSVATGMRQAHKKGLENAGTLTEAGRENLDW
jgi:hypothetical protein